MGCQLIVYSIGIMFNAFAALEFFIMANTAFAKTKFFSNVEREIESHSLVSIQ